MAEVRLADIYEPTTFDARLQERATELNAFIQSGILVEDPRISAMAAVGGMVGELPNFNSLVNDEPDYTDDDPTNTSTPAKIDSATQIYRLANQHKSWSTMDLSRQLALADPLGAIVDSIAHYWTTNTQQRVISSAVGVLLDNVATDDDMSIDVFIEAGNSATAANLIGSDVVIDATGTLGDHSGSVTAIGLHSAVYNNLKKQNLIAFIPASRGEVAFETYLNLRVIVDDNLHTRAGTTNGVVYTTVLFGQGAFGYGTAAPLVPSEINRVPGSGNGGGQDIIHSRVSEIIHPQGFAFASAGLGQGISANRTALEAAAQWSRTYADRKNIPLAFIRTNG